MHTQLNLVDRKPVIDVIIPALNEEAAIVRVIREIPGGIVREVIVCDNGSTDKTALHAEKSGATVVHVPERGYGNACLAGIAHIEMRQKKDQPDIVVFLDGDHSDHPGEMPELIKAILQDDADLVIGSRALGKADKGSMTFVQRFGNTLSTSLIALLYRYRFTDLGPFRAIRWKTLQSLGMADQNFGWTVEMQVKAARKGLVCKEVPVSYRRRIGRSKVSGTLKGSILAGHKILLTIFRNLV